MADYSDFRIELRGEGLVVVFRPRTGVIAEGCAEATESVLDEQALLDRIDTRAQQGAETAVEQWALGELRLAKFIRNLRAKQDGSDPSRKRGDEKDTEDGSVGRT